MSEASYPKYLQNFTARAYEMHYELLKTFLQRERLTNEQLSTTLHKQTFDQSTQTLDNPILPYNRDSSTVQAADCIPNDSEELLILSIDPKCTDLAHDSSEESHSKAWSTAETSPIPGKFIHNLKIEIDDIDVINIHKPPLLNSKGSRKSSIKYIKELEPIFRHTEPVRSNRGFSKDLLSDESLSRSYCNMPNFSPISVDNPFNFYIDEDLEWSFNPKEREFSRPNVKVEYPTAHNYKLFDMPKPRGDQNSFTCSPSWSENSTPKLNSPETSYSGNTDEWSGTPVEVNYRLVLPSYMYSSGYNA